MTTQPFTDACQHIARLLLARYASLYEGLLPRPGSHEPLNTQVLAWLQGQDLWAGKNVQAWEAELTQWRQRLQQLQPQSPEARRWHQLLVKWPQHLLESDLVCLLVAFEWSPHIVSTIRHLSGWVEASGIERTFLALILDPQAEHIQSSHTLFHPQGRVARAGLVRGLNQHHLSRGVFLDLDPVASNWLNLGLEATCERLEGIEVYQPHGADLATLSASHLLDEDLLAQGHAPVVRLQSAGGADVRLYARALANQSQRVLLQLTLQPQTSTEAQLERLREAGLLASLEQAPLLLRGLDSDESGEERLNLESLTQALRHFEPPLFLEDISPEDVPGLASKLAQSLKAYPLSLPFPKLPERTQAWLQLNPLLPESIAERLAVFPLSLEQISELAPHAESNKGLAQQCRDAVGHRVGQLAQRVSTKIRWQDVVLPEPVAQVAREMVAFARHREQVFSDWGFGKRHSYGLGLTALFSGPPGTGKTMLAGLVAKDLGLDLFKIDVSRIVSKYIGETEERLGRLFAEASRGGVALLFDEADSLFAKRTEVKSSTDRYANLEVNFLLQKMEEFDGVAILTTNFSQSLDEAFRRRIRFHARFQIPNADEREALWQAMLPPNAPLAEAIDFYALAHAYEFTGAEIKNASLRAAFLAASTGQALNLELLDKASRLECEERGRLVLKTAFDFR